MVELTEREIKIIRYLHIMQNPQIANVPFELKNNLIQTTFLTANIKFNEEEMTDIGQAVNAEIRNITKDGLKFMDKHKGAFKGLSGLGMGTK